MFATKLVAISILLAWSPQQKGIDGTDSAVTASRSIQGTSVFADGDPLSKVELEFRLRRLSDATTEKERDSTPESCHCETDSEGSFELKLPSGAEYSAAVVATKWIDGDRRRWRCSIPKLSSGMRDPLDLVFENRGRMLLAFLGTSNLTEDSKPSITCTTAGNDDHVLLHRHLKPDSRGRLIIDGLEPREYTIDVYVNNLRAKSWKQSVTVPANSPFRAVAQFQFPEFKFGTFQAIIVLPDGKTPAAKTRLFAHNVDEESNSFGSKELMTDSEGFVSARMGVGEFQLSYPADPRIDAHRGVAPALFHDKVKPDGLTDMGKLRLQSEEEVFAWINGTIKYSNGQPVEKLIPGGRLVFFSRAIPMFSLGEAFQPDPKLDPGSFSIRVTAGKQVVAIGLEGTGQLGGGFPAKFSDDKQIFLSLDLAAGDRIHRDIVLLNREGDSSLKVNFEDPSAAMVVNPSGNVLSAATVILLVEVAPGIVFRSKGHFENGFKIFENVPSGECLIIVQADWGGYAASRTIAPDSELREISFSQQDVGKVQVAINDVERMESKSLALQLSIDSPLQAIPFFSIKAEDPKLKRNSDGSLIWEGIAPGKYRLTVGDGKRKLEQNCEVESQKTTKLQF